MKTQPIIPARLTFTEAGVPFAADYGDIYHPHAGALAQARHVFLAGNQLPARWQGRAHFTILETGFGLGNNFLATWQAWQADAHRSTRLSFVSIEQHPLSRDDLAGIRRAPELAALADALVAAWPALTPNLHRLAFAGGRVELLLALGDVQSWLPELQLRADAFFLDGFAPARNPRMWDLRVCKALGRLAAPGATLATWSAARALRADLTTAGFEVSLGAGIGGKRDITLARHRGWPSARGVATEGPPNEEPPAAGKKRALIIGAGLAGCAAAWALAEHGWHSTLCERGPAIAGEASGNPAGLFHGSVNREDGVHARLLRAAALEIRSVVATAVAAHGVAGATDGLLRLEAASSLDDMQRLLLRLGLPGGFVRAVPARQAAALCGLPLALPAWFYPGGGWVDPAGLARSFVERAGSRVKLRTATAVQALRRAGGRWQLLDAQGALIDEAAVVVLANAGDALRLLDDAGIGGAAIDWRSSRGQVSWLPAAAAPSSLGACRLPIAGGGYLSPAAGGRLMFGATSQPDDPDPSVRLADHLENLARLRQLTGLALTDLSLSTLSGRTAWRWSTSDRLPLIGPAPRESDTGAVGGTDLRRMAREPGLFLYAGLGSRGILWSALGARILAAQVSGAPLPVEASLQRAVDPARFLCRAVRLGRAAGSLDDLRAARSGMSPSGGRAGS